MIRVYNGKVFTPLPGLRRLREERGLSARQLAERANMTYVNILNIENGIQKARMSSLEKLAIALEVEGLEELLLDDASIEGLAEQRGELLKT